MVCIMKENIYHLYTKLSVTECTKRLREQVQPLTLWNRVFFFARRTSKVVGQVGDKEFMLEATKDLFSKRMKGRLVESPSGTTIEFEWKKPFWSRLYGFYKFDEDEILSFFKNWLEVENSLTMTDKEKSRL